MQIPDVASVPPLAGPHEIFDLPGNSTREFTVTKYVLGRMTITPRETKIPKEIVALRVWVPNDDKPLYPDYWDVTAQTLIPQLVPPLDAAQGEPVRFRVTKFGSGPTARFQVAANA